MCVCVCQCEGGICLGAYKIFKLCMYYKKKEVSKECTNFLNLDSLKNGTGGRIYLFLFSLNFVLTSIVSVLLCFPFPVGFNRER